MMLGYVVPAVLILATALGAQLAMGKPWLSALLAAAIALLLPYGDLHGRPLILVLADLPKQARRKKRRGWRRHRYFSP